MFARDRRRVTASRWFALFNLSLGLSGQWHIIPSPLTCACASLPSLNQSSTRQHTSSLTRTVIGSCLLYFLRRLHLSLAVSSLLSVCLSSERPAHCACSDRAFLQLRFASRHGRFSFRSCSRVVVPCERRPSKRSSQRALRLLAFFWLFFTSFFLSCIFDVPV